MLWSQREGGSGSECGWKGWPWRSSSLACWGSCASSNSRMMLAQLVMFSRGSQVASCSANPFHFTRYCSRPPRSLFFRMRQTYQVFSESESELRSRPASRSALVRAVCLCFSCGIFYPSRLSSLLPCCNSLGSNIEQSLCFRLSLRLFLKIDRCGRVCVCVVYTYLMKEGSYLDSLQYLDNTRRQINNLNNTSANAVTVFKQFVGRVTGGDHLGVIVALCNDDYLERLLKVAQYQLDGSKRNEDLERCIAILYLYAYDSFFKLRPKYKALMDYFRPKIEKLVNGRTYKDYGGENKRYEAMKELLRKFEECNSETKQEYPRGKDLNSFVGEVLAQEVPQGGFEECVLTWLRQQVEEAHGRIVRDKEKKQEVSFCCSLHFDENGIRQHVEMLTQNFSREVPARKFREDVEQRDSIKRQVVSYLNTAGGIHYIGIDLNFKEVRFVGVPLTDKDRIEVLSFVLNEIAMKIFPCEDENEEETEKQEEARLEFMRQEKLKEFAKNDCTFWKEYEINRYISVDFLPLYSRHTLFYTRTESNLSFVVRIKVKPGDQYEVYHFINDKDVPEAYVRDGNKEKKLTMIEYYDEVYRRLKDKANNRVSNPPTRHALCRFNLKSDKTDPPK